MRPGVGSYGFVVQAECTFTSMEGEGASKCDNFPLITRRPLAPRSSDACVWEGGGIPEGRGKGGPIMQTSIYTSHNHN